MRDPQDPLSSRLRLTDSGNQELSRSIDRFRRFLEDELARRKFVPGEDKIEATASDVRELESNLNVSVRDRQTSMQRQFTMQMVSMAMLGVVTLLVSLLWRFGVLDDLSRPYNMLFVVSIAMIVVSMAGMFMLRFLGQIRRKNLGGAEQRSEVFYGDVRSEVELLAKMRASLEKELGRQHEELAEKIKQSLSKSSSKSSD